MEKEKRVDERERPAEDFGASLIEALEEAVEVKRGEREAKVVRREVEPPLF
jgi:hypothetical protein